MGGYDDSFGGAPGGIGKPRGRWLGRLLVLAIVLVIVGVVIALISNSSSKDTGHGTDPFPPEPTRASAPARIPGWVAVTDSADTIAYDVPADWQISAVGDGINLSTSDWTMPLTMLARRPNGTCEVTARSGAATVQIADASTAATTTARGIAQSVYGPGGAPTITLSTPTPTAITNGVGMLVTAHVTLPAPTHCQSPTALVDVLALASPSHHDSVVVVAYSYQQTPTAIGQSDLDRIVTSIRKLPAH